MPNCRKGRGCSRGWPDRLHLPAGTPRLLPICDGEGDRPKPRRGEGGWRGAPTVSSPLRGEGDRPKPRRGEGGWRGADRTVLSTPPPSFGWSPSPFAARTGRRRDAHNPPIVSISPAANPLTPLAFQNKQRHEPSALDPVSDSWPSRRWGGRRIQRPDVGGLWSSDEARGTDTPGVLAGVDGWLLFARRALPARTAGACRHVRRASQSAMAAGRSGQVRTQGHYPEGAWKTAARGRSASSKR
jgi:hypothetical protein